MNLKKDLLLQKDRSIQRELEKEFPKYHSREIYGSVLPRIAVEWVYKGNKVITSDPYAKFSKAIKALQNIDDHFKTIKVRGCTFRVLRYFDALIRSIENSKYILDLKENWDDEGGIVVPSLVYKNAITTLIQYNQLVFMDFGILLAAPIISPCPDGSIDIHFKNEKAELLLNFRNSEKGEVFYYGDEFNTYSKYKGNFLTTEIQEHLVVWLKKLSSDDGRDLEV